MTKAKKDKIIGLSALAVVAVFGAYMLLEILRVAG